MCAFHHFFFVFPLLILLLSLRICHNWFRFGRMTWQREVEFSPQDSSGTGAAGAVRVGANISRFIFLFCQQIRMNECPPSAQDSVNHTLEHSPGNYVCVTAIRYNLSSNLKYERAALAAWLIQIGYIQFFGLCASGSLLHTSHSWVNFGKWRRIISFGQSYWIRSSRA